MAEDYGNSYTRFALDQSLKHRAALQALPLDAAVAQRFAGMAEESLALQRRMEAQSKLPFEEWRKQYLAVEKLRP